MLFAILCQSNKNVCIICKCAYICDSKLENFVEHPLVDPNSVILHFQTNSLWPHVLI